MLSPNAVSVTNRILLTSIALGWRHVSDVLKPVQKYFHGYAAVVKIAFFKTLIWVNLPLKIKCHQEGFNK